MENDFKPATEQMNDNHRPWDMIYAVASIILVFFCIGYFLIFSLAITHLIFIILGAIKANNGETFKFPLAIPFVK